MKIFPEVKALGDVLRVDDFKNDGVRNEVADIANLPPSLLAIVHKHVSDIHIAPKPISELGRSGYMRRFKEERPRGFEKGETMDQAAGLFVSYNREVLVAAQFRVGRPQSIALHEIGHALDASHFRKPTSITDAFVDAWEEFKGGDFTYSKHPYFTQAYPAGPEETFAEAFSVYFTHGPDAVARRFGPKVVEVLNSKYGPEIFPPAQQS